MLSFSSCEVDRDMEICDYNLQIEYWYAGNASKNDLKHYVDKIDEYIFNDKGILCMVNRIEIDPCVREFVSEQTLPPGNYSVVSWGNVKDASRVTQAEIGKTSIEEMQLELARRSGESHHPFSEAIHHGFRTFSVPAVGVGHTRVVMAHTYFLLDVTVRWKSKAPDNTHDFSMTLEQTHDRYPFLPHYTVTSSFVTPFAIGEEDYGDNDMKHRYYLVNRHPAAQYVNQRKEVKMDITRSINGQFTGYRISNDSHPILRLYSGDEPLMKEIDLHKFFSQMSIELNMNIKQEFFLLIEIDGDKVTVMPMTFSDWINGGEIGGQI